MANWRKFIVFAHLKNTIPRKCRTESWNEEFLAFGFEQEFQVTNISWENNTCSTLCNGHVYLGCTYYPNGPLFLIAIKHQRKQTWICYCVRRSLSNSQWMCPTINGLLVCSSPACHSILSVWPFVQFIYPPAALCCFCSTNDEFVWQSNNSSQEGKLWEDERDFHHAHVQFKFIEWEH